MPEPAREVHLLQLPVALWARSQDHAETVLREFSLIALDDPEGDDVPQRLLALITGFDADYAELAERQADDLRAAAANGVEVIDDLVYLSPPSGGEQARTFDELLDQADGYSERAQLLALAGDSEITRFRHWFLSAFVDQLAGKPPVAWPDWP